jgi:hypothetical protein
MEWAGISDHIISRNFFACCVPSLDGTLLWTLSTCILQDSSLEHLPLLCRACSARSCCSILRMQAQPTSLAREGLGASSHMHSTRCLPSTWLPLSTHALFQSSFQKRPWKTRCLFCMVTLFRRFAYNPDRLCIARSKASCKRTVCLHSAAHTKLDRVACAHVHVAVAACTIAVINEQ